MDFIENIREIHIGKIIERKLAEKSMTKTELADKISKERSTVYDIFDRKSVDTELLIDISKALDYDFIRNIYYGEKTSPTIFVAVKMEEDELKNLHLPNEFVRLVKNKK
jgi:predicted transcriptional regulator